MSKLEEIAGLKYRITKFQKQSDLMKTKFFDYVEKLQPDFNVISNINREDSEFDIFSNRIKFISSYDPNNIPFLGYMGVCTISKVENDKVLKIITYYHFDQIGNISNKSNANYDIDDFAEYLYLEISNEILTAVDLNSIDPLCKNKHRNKFTILL